MSRKAAKASPELASVTEKTPLAWKCQKMRDYEKYEAKEAILASQKWQNGKWGGLSETREEDFQHRAWATSGLQNFCAKFEFYDFCQKLPDLSGGTVQIAGRPCQHSMVVLAWCVHVSRYRFMEIL